jgi:hypothetical protein
LQSSHLIVYVADTDASIAFWCKGMGGVLGRTASSRRPRWTRCSGAGRANPRHVHRDRRRAAAHDRAADVRAESFAQRAAGERRPSVGRTQGDAHVGIDGLVRGDDIESAHARTAAEGLRPTPIYDFRDIEQPCRMFFSTIPTASASRCSTFGRPTLFQLRSLT